MRRRVLLSFLFALSSLAAQGPTRDVHGTVTRGGEPVRGAIVELKDTKTLAVRSFITDKNGHYQFYDLNTDSDYEIRAQYHGKWSQTYRLSRFNEAHHPTINLKIRTE